MVFDEDTQNPQGRQASQKVRLTQAFELGGGGRTPFLAENKELIPETQRQDGEKETPGHSTDHVYLPVHIYFNKQTVF